MSPRSFLSALAIVTAVVSSTAAVTNPDTPTTTSLPPLELPCNPIFPSCNGTWICNSAQTLTYIPEYGYLCENINNVVQLSPTVLCPFGGVLTGDMCLYAVDFMTPQTFVTP